MNKPGILQGSALADFAGFFQLTGDDRSEISFLAVINCFGMGGIQKLDAKVRICSDRRPMDTICIEAELAEVAGLPTRLQQENNTFHYLPGQFLMIAGNEGQYGHYNILLYPKMKETVME